MTCDMATYPVLFIAPTRIGDAVLASSILAHIAATEPSARVTIATSTLAAPLYAGFPQLERIIPITKRSYNRHWLALWRETMGTGWYALWDMRHSILSYTLRARHRHTYTPPKQVAPKVKQYEMAFGTGALPHPVLWPRTEDIAAAHALLPEGGRYLILAPIANWEPKEWPLDAFTTLARSLLSGACAGYRPVIICAGHERVKALPMLAALADFAPIDLTHGDHHLLTLYAAMQRAHGFVGNDSGLMHMAAAAGIPTLGLFGPTPSAIYQPCGKRAAFIQSPDRSMEAITPEQVHKAFTQLMRG